MELSSAGYQVVFGIKGYDCLNKLITEKTYSKVFILTDNQVNECCLPYFLQQFVVDIPFEIIEIETGEEQKNIETCLQLWNILAEFEADRKALVLNIGGRSEERRVGKECRSRWAADE